MLKSAQFCRGGGGAKWDAHEQIQISQELLNTWQYNFISDQTLLKPTHKPNIRL